MSSASYRNFTAANAERQRRNQLYLDDPSMPTVNTAPAWDAFYGSLHDLADRAHASGMDLRVDQSGLGRLPTSATLDNPNDAAAAKSFAVNSALSGLMAQRNQDETARRVGTAQAQAAEATARDAQRQQEDIGAIDQAGASATLGSTNPMVQRERLLSSLPPHLRPAYEARYAAEDQKAAAAQLETDKLAETVRSHKAAEQIAADGTLTPDAIDTAADYFNQTGIMPALGQKDPGNRARILNRAGEKMKQSGGTVASNKADYKADSGSLTALQKQRDAIGAFENTAGKNIDLFLDAAKNVIDTGSPLLNAPLRAINGKVLGAPNQAAYDAARQVAVNEIAKITSNPTLSGQLSDSARHEVDAFNPDSATFGQTIAVMKLLRKDMGNRVGSLDDQLKTIKGRIGGGSATTTQSSATSSHPKGSDPGGIR